MDNFPKPHEDYQQLLDMVFEPVRTKLLLTAIELKVFNHLHKPETADSLACKLGTHPENTMYFLDGLAACSLVSKSKGLYINAPLAREFLVEGTAYYLGDFILSSYKWVIPLMDNMSGLLKDGPYKEHRSSDPDVWIKAARSMANMQKAGRAQMIRDVIVNLPEFKRFSKMLDLGCGPGLVGIAVTEAHPSMHGVLYDQAAVIEIAKEYVFTHGMEDRITLLAGNCLEDDLGQDYDLIIASNILYIAKNSMLFMLKKIYDALRPGGVLVSFHGGLYNEGTEPSKLVLSWLSTTMSEYNMALDQGMIAEAALQSGFGSVRSICGDYNTDVDIARKCNRS